VRGWSRTQRAGCLACIGLALLVAACGGTGTASVTVPTVAGLGLSDAAARLCHAGLLVAVNETRTARSPAAPGAFGGRTRLRVTGTTPAQGAVVPPRTVVTVNVTAPIGVATIIRLPSSCTGSRSST
jgi:beta-lactam-binding protein with PASTA domain